MVGHHLTGTGLKSDETMSLSSSFLDLLVLGGIRRTRAQGAYFSQWFDRRKAQRDHQQASIYPARTIINTVDVFGAEIWGATRRKNSQSRLFTSEYLLHGEMKYNANEFRAVSIQELIDNGLLDVFPEMSVPDGRVESNFYTRKVALRRELFAKARKIKPDHIDEVVKLARLFVHDSPAADKSKPWNNGIDLCSSASTCRYRLPNSRSHEDCFSSLCLYIQ